jgi:hypothetical protein
MCICNGPHQHGIIKMHEVPMPQVAQMFFHCFLWFEIHLHSQSQNVAPKPFHHMGEITVKRAKGAKVNVLFQGLHMTHFINAMVYNFKLCISNTPLSTSF